MLLDLDVVVEPELALFPLCVGVWFRRQGLQRRALQLLEQRLAARTKVPSDPGIQCGYLDGAMAAFNSASEKKVRFLSLATMIQRVATSTATSTLALSRGL